MLPSRHAAQGARALRPVPARRRARGRRRAAARGGRRATRTSGAPATRSCRSSATRAGCGVSGSGWVAGDGIVVTNAHVVAGQDETFVEPRGGGGRLEATAIAFDSKNDIAVLRVRGPRPDAAAVRARGQGLRAGGDRGLPAGRAVSDPPGADRADARRDLAGRLRPRARAPQDHGVSRQRAAGQLRRADRRRRRARLGDGLRGVRRRRAAAAATPCRT